jgi:hypothetical protein
MKTVRVYDGSLWCAGCDHCPVVDFEQKKGSVTIHDPAKPEKGRVTISVEEYNALIAHAKPIGRT